MKLLVPFYAGDILYQEQVSHKKAATTCRCLQKRWMLQVTIPDFEHGGHFLLGVCETKASSISNSHPQDDKTRLTKAVLPVSLLIWFTFPWDSIYDILCLGSRQSSQISLLRGTGYDYDIGMNHDILFLQGRHDSKIITKIIGFAGGVSM